MKLSHELETFRKDDLLEFAAFTGIDVPSGLRIKELRKKIMEGYLAKDRIRKYSECLSDEEVKYYRKAALKENRVGVKEIMAASRLDAYGYGRFDMVQWTFCPFEDVKEVFTEVDDEAFAKEQYKRGWMSECLRYFSDFYGFGTIELLHLLYTKKIICDISEMIELLRDIPYSIRLVHLYDESDADFEELPQEHFMHTNHGYLLSLDVDGEESLEALLDCQMDKDFFIPTKKQIDDFAKTGADLEKQEYKTLKTYFKEEYGLSKDDAYILTKQIWSLNYMGMSMQEIMEYIQSTGLLSEDHKEFVAMAERLIHAHNQTRLIENRGFTPRELSEYTRMDCE